MLRSIALALVTVLLVGMLAACGGSDDPTPTETPVPAQPATPTATMAPTATTEPAPTVTAVSTATPTAEPTRTPAPAPTRLIPTATPRPEPTPVPTEPVGTTPEQLLRFAALSEEDLGEGWVLESIEVPSLDTGPETGFCGQPHFPDRDERVAALDVRLDREDGSAIVMQGLVVYPYTTSIAAMDYAMEMSAACDGWIADDGTAIDVMPLEDPLLGDDSFALLLSFELNGTPIETYNVYIREDEYLMALTYVVQAGGDISPLLGIAQTATAKMFAVSESYFFPEYDEDFLAQSGALLLTTPEIPGGWTLAEYAIPPESDRYGLCDADPFPDLYAARSEIAAYFHIDPENGPFLMHSIVAMENVEAADVAMMFIRDSTSCADWTDEFNDYYVVVDRPALALGDDTYTIVSQFEAFGFGTVQLSGTFIRTGSIITVLLYSQLGEIDVSALESYGALAIGKLGR